MSASEQAEFVHLDEYVYKVVPLPARRGMVVMRRVLAMAALLPADKLRAAAEAFKRGAREGSPEMMALGIDLLGSVAAGTSDADLEFLVTSLASATWYAHSQTPDNLVPLSGALDVHFMRSYKRMLGWLWRALLTNFPDFQRAFSPLAEALKARAPAAG
jgi:hypothetical protein